MCLNNREELRQSEEISDEELLRSSEKVKPHTTKVACFQTS